MSAFRIAPRPLVPNPHFMDIHKRTARQPTDAFKEFKDYNNRIQLLFSDIPHEHRFWLQNGVPLNNLKELYSALDSMSDEVYDKHAKGSMNDFASWVSNVYHDEELALKLMRAGTRREAKAAIEERIDEILGIDENTKNDKSLILSLIRKLSKQNEDLKKQLVKKKTWIEHKEKQLQEWEDRNIEQEKKLYDQFQRLEEQEKRLLERFQKLQAQEMLMQKEMAKERQRLEHESKTLESTRHEIEIQSKTVHNERLQMQKEEKALQELRKMLQSKERELKRSMQIHRAHREESLREILARKHEPIYMRLDELLSLATTSVINKNFKEARDCMSKVRYYYSTLPDSSPRKREFYNKILKLRKYINDTLNTVSIKQ